MAPLLRVYNTALLPLRAAAALWGAWARLQADRALEAAERRARVLPRSGPGGVWLHGASVGEVKIVTAIAGALRRGFPDLPIAVSALTRTGRAQLPKPPLADAAFFMPFDFPGFHGRLLDALLPRTLVLVETELWPNLLAERSERGVAACLVNGRLSPERMARYRRFAPLYRPLLAGLDRLGAQTAEDGRRFLELGAREEVLEVTGSIKYDLPAAEVLPEALRRRFGLDSARRVVASGSTAEGEDGPILDAFLETRRDHPGLFLLIAPRHPDRAPAVQTEARSRGLRLHPLSTRRDAEAGRSDGLLVDTLGELAGLWPVADAAFVGGSLVAVGGHNVLEPAACGVPVLFGPYTHHIAEPAETLEREGAARRVRDGRDLAQTWSELLGDETRRRAMGQRGLAVIGANRGALDRSVALVVSLLRERVPAARAGGGRA